PYKPTTVVVQAVAVTDDSPAVPEHTIVETPMNILLVLAKQLRKCEKLSKGYNKVNPLTFTSEEDSDPEQAQRDKDMQKNLALIAKYFKKIYKPNNNNLRTSSNSRKKNVDTTSRKPKRVKDSVYHKEKMLLCKQAEKGVLLQAEQYDWLADTNKEIDEQELEAHYSYMAKI
nr:hypothetical protein [Tanacetum cinerariifolium]